MMGVISTEGELGRSQNPEHLLKVHSLEQQKKAFVLLLEKGEKPVIDFCQC